MQLYDLIMLAILGGATLFGLIKGMAWQMASLGSIVVSYFVALNFSGPLAPMMPTQAPLNKFIAMAVLYTASSFAVWLAFRVVANAIDRVRLKEFDRQIGALFGACKGVLLCIAITFFAVTLSAGARASVLKSRSGGYIAQALNKADAVMPKELHEVLDPYMDKLERGLDPDEPNPTLVEGDFGEDDFGDSVGKQIGKAVENTWKSKFGKVKQTLKESLDRDSQDDRNWNDEPDIRRTTEDWGRSASQWSRRAADAVEDAVDDYEEEFPPRQPRRYER